MKPPDPDLQSDHILRLARRCVTLPFVFGRAAYRWLKRVVQRVKSGREVHRNDRAHQSQVRRELRGLPSDHVQPDVQPPADKR